MTETIILEGEVGEDGRLVVQIPPDGPRGPVEVIVRKVAPERPAPELTPEQEAALDAELEALLDDPATFDGLGLTAGEIANSPEIGIWADREDMRDSAAYVEKIRSRRRKRHWNVGGQVVIA